MLGIMEIFKMITKKQLITMQEQINVFNFCNDVNCRDCPLNRGTADVCNCIRTDLSDKLIDIEEKQYKKYCSECGAELKLENNDEVNKDNE